MNKINKLEFPNIFLKEFVFPIPKNKLKYILPEKRGYLWNACCFNLSKYLYGEDAKNAYDKIDKNEAIELQYDNGFVGDEYTAPLKEEHNTAEKIKREGLYEFYVIGKNFEWCFVVTHELDLCGPFFIFGKNKQIEI